MFSRRSFLRTLVVAIVVTAASSSLVQAHHGWRWAEDGNFIISGTITEARLGNPHGLLTLNVNGEAWTIEVGQPWRNERAGLTEALMSPGTDIEVTGHRSREATDRRVKAERVKIKGKTYDLYPNRD